LLGDHVDAQARLVQLAGTGNAGEEVTQGRRRATAVAELAEHGAAAQASVVDVQAQARRALHEAQRPARQVWLRLAGQQQVGDGLVDAADVVAALVQRDGLLAAQVVARRVGNGTTQGRRQEEGCDRHAWSVLQRWRPAYRRGGGSGRFQGGQGDDAGTEPASSSRLWLYVCDVSA